MSTSGEIMASELNADVEFCTSEKLKGLPFSAEVRVGQMLYLSEQFGTDSGGN
jgi:hypothetical protein